jgi:hypothetical protein
VEARRHTPLPEVLEEWERCSAAVEPLVGQFDPMMRAMFVTDAVTHEHDLRGALGRPGARDSDALALAFRGVTRGIGAQRDGAGAGALRIVHDAGESAVGTGDPMVTLHTTRFEIVRAAVGRRAEAQMAAWDWDGDARTQTMVLALFAPPRSTPLDE